jgi:hypothetical protein
MAEEPFGDALKFKQLICLLKEAGHTDTPSLMQAFDVARKNSELRKWLESQGNLKRFEDLLRLHWDGRQ